MSCDRPHLIHRCDPEHTVVVIRLQTVLLRPLLPALLFSVAVVSTVTADDALELRLRIEEAEALIGEARGFVRRGQYADALAAARAARSLVRSLPRDAGTQLRALRIDPERHRRREPPRFTSVEQTQPRIPAGIREASVAGTPLLSIDVSDSVMEVYDARRNPWNGDPVYLYNETIIQERSASSTLHAGIHILRSTEDEPFDLRAMEIQVASRRYRYGFPDETVRRTRDNRWYREFVSIPLNSDLRREIENGIDLDPIRVILEGNEERIIVPFGASEREGVRRMLEWTNSDPDTY